MALTIHCDIASAEEKIYSGLVQYVVVTGTMGDMGIYPGHAPLLTALTPGPVRLVRDNGDEEIYYVSGGYLEVQPWTVNILADYAVRGGDVDEANAEAAKKAALDAINNQKAEFEYSTAASQLAEAAARLRTLEQVRKRRR